MIFLVHLIFILRFFADDTNLLLEHRCIKTLQTEVLCEMIKIENWIKNNELTTNKSCFIIICKNSLNVDDFKLIIQNDSTEKTKIFVLMSIII